jgi:hypothetical protein
MREVNCAVSAYFTRNSTGPSPPRKLDLNFRISLNSKSVMLPQPLKSAPFLATIVTIPLKAINDEEINRKYCNPLHQCWCSSL